MTHLIVCAGVAASPSQRGEMVATKHAAVAYRCIGGDDDEIAAR